MMKTTVLITSLFCLLLLSACSSQGKVRVEPEAVDDYVLVGELKSVTRMPTRNTDRWTDITDRHVIYSNRRTSYLIEFRRTCHALSREFRDFGDADIRYDSNWIRVGMDTLRGCLISEIYELEDYQVDELKNLGEVPKPRS